jgi:hypothetical protein
MLSPLRRADAVEAVRLAYFMAYPPLQQPCEGQCRWVIPGIRLRQCVISSAPYQNLQQRVVRGMWRARIAPAVHRYLDRLAAECLASVTRPRRRVC